MLDKHFFKREEDEKILNIFLKVVKGKLDSNNIIHIGKCYGKNKTDKIRPENVLDFYKKLKRLNKENK